MLIEVDHPNMDVNGSLIVVGSKVRFVGTKSLSYLTGDGEFEKGMEGVVVVIDDLAFPIVCNFEKSSGELLFDVPCLANELRILA